MNKHHAHTHQPEAELNTPESAVSRRGALGQAMVEYVLIIVLLAIGFGFALAFTGPAIGNVFNNVLFQFVGQDPSLPVDPLSNVGSPNNFWATVTWVAQNRQTETPFPTPINRPTLAGGPSGGGNTATPTFTRTFTPTLTPSQTNTYTPTLTPSMTSTYTYTPSPGPSPTPSDRVFDVPHVDQMGNPDWWRLGRSTIVEEIGAGTWSAQYYNNISNAGTAATWAFSGAVVGTNTLPSTTDGGFDRDWGSGNESSVGITNGNTWGIRMTKSVTFPVAQRINVSILANDWFRFRVNGTQVMANTTPNTTVTQIITFPSGTYNIEIDFAENTNTARLLAIFSRLNNVDDTVQNCTWQPTEDTTAAVPDNNAISTGWLFAQDPTALGSNGTAYTAGQTCILELRGYVDLSTTTHPLLSFWDYWELPANVNASLQVANYVEVVPGGTPPELNRGSLSWQTISLRTGGTTNHNWTRNEIDISALGLTDKVTFRFVLTNNGGSTSSGAHRWFIEDLQVLDDPTPTEFFTVNDVWDLDDRTQMDDFIFDGETMRTLEVTGGVPNQLNGSSLVRWDLTSTYARSGTAFDDSPGYNHVNRMYNNTNPRVSFIEFKYPIDLTAANAPAADSNGNTGRPLLTFYTTYHIDNDTNFQVEYAPASRTVTGAPANAANPGGWTLIPTDGRMYRDGGCSTCDTNELDDDDVLAGGFRQITVRLDLIPNYNTQPFRLRIALYAFDGDAEGVYIDDISFSRAAGGSFMAYPFTDDAENPGFTNTVWNFANGEWAASTERGGYNNTANAYTDRPGSNYRRNRNYWMETKLWLDLLYDTTDNVNNPGTIGEPLRSGPGIQPVLSFYHQRETNDGDYFTVDIWIEQTRQWYTIWQYTDSKTWNQANWSRTQKTWERVEIDLIAAAATALGKTVTAITNNVDGQVLDDDLLIRFRMFSNDDNKQAAGIFVDNIYVGDRNEFVHRLWNATPFGSVVTGSGDGVYEDRIEAASRTLNTTTTWNPASTALEQRWFLGGTWQGANDGTGYYRSASVALTESPRNLGSEVEFNYEVEHFLEMRPVIDLRGTDPADRPMLTFWARYDIGDDDRLRVQIASENAADLTQSHDKMAGWTRWEPNRLGYTRPYMFNSAPIAYWQRVSDTSINQGSAEQRDAWQLYQVDLSSFVGNRIRIRFMLDSDHNTTLSPPRGDGLYLDDISVRFGFTELISGAWSQFEDAGGSPNNWIFEGAWGFTDQYSNTPITGDGFGSSPWVGYIFDCETMITNNPALGIASWQCQDTAQGATAYTAVANNISSPAGFENGSSGIMGPYTRTNLDFVRTWSPDQLFGLSDAGLQHSVAFADTVFARFTRTVILAPGSYSITTRSDDGVRLSTSVTTGILVGGTPLVGSYLINNFSDHLETEDVINFQVTQPLTTVLTLEYYNKYGNGRLTVGTDANDFSYTDTPNTANPGAPGGYDTVNSIGRGDASMMTNGYFNLSTAPNRRLAYDRIWNLANNQSFHIDISTDGGFTWTRADDNSAYNDIDGGESLWGSWSNIPPSPWQRRYVLLPQAANVMFRFRMDTRSTSSPFDGIYIDNITVTY